MSEEEELFDKIVKISSLLLEKLDARGTDYHRKNESYIISTLFQQRGQLMDRYIHASTKDIDMVNEDHVTELIDISLAIQNKLREDIHIVENKMKMTMETAHARKAYAKSFRL